MEQEGTFFSIDDTDECHCSEGIFQSSPLATPPDSMKYSFRPKPALVGAALTPTLSSLNELVESNQGQLQPYIMPGVLATPTSHNASLGSTTPIGGSVAESSYESASARRGDRFCIVPSGRWKTLPPVPFRGMLEIVEG